MSIESILVIRTEAEAVSGMRPPFVVPLPGRGSLPLPLLSLGHFGVDFPLPDLCAAPLKVSQFAPPPGFDEDEDDGFEHFVPVESEHDEEEDFGE
jgi:hypothetical protein